MGKVTEIQWADHTFNPWRGCTKVSEGCANCYAERESKRNPGVLGIWGPEGSRVAASETMWREPLKWDKAAAAAGERHRVFCASFADVFEDFPECMRDSSGCYLLICDSCGRWCKDNDDALVESCECGRFKQRMDELRMHDVRTRLFKLIDATPNLDWLILTKRPENIQGMMPAYFPGGYIAEAAELNQEGPRPNVWLGVSVENQAAADERIPELLKIPAAVRFLSCEPLLGPVDLANHLTDAPNFTVRILSSYYRNQDGTSTEFNPKGDGKQYDRVVKNPLPLHWVIAGGESGPHARPCHPDWIRSLRNQCHAAGVPFFFKQWGEWGAVHHPIGGPADRAINGQIDCRYGEWHSDGLFVEDCLCGDGSGTVARVGKKAAGRQLDGREWSEFPERTVSHA